ncbi:MAG: hypothetical protein H6934_00015 [Burkholderiaceae bacterium]|nr:hypothetical protein [Burkholderiaceae bacterium]
MRRLVVLVLVLSAAVAVAMLLRVNTGSLAIVWPPYRLDISVNLALLVVLLGFLAFYLLARVIGQTVRLPARIRRYRARRRRERAAAALRDGVMALFEGRFGRAERLAERVRQEPEFNNVAALLGARAAQGVHASERRDRWLSMASEDKGGIMAAGLLRAEIALADGRAADALSAMTEAVPARGRNTHALRLQLDAHAQQLDWERSLDVLRELEKRQAVSPEDSGQMRHRALLALFESRQGDAAAVRELYRRLTPAERDDDELVHAAALAFARSGDGARGARLVQGVLEKRVVPRLLDIYIQEAAVPVRERMLSLESWLDREPDDPELLTALGRLCASQQIWGKAEEYLTRAVGKGASREARLALASVYEHLDRAADAARIHRELATTKPALPAPGAAPPTLVQAPNRSPGGNTLEAG